MLFSAAVLVEVKVESLSAHPSAALGRRFNQDRT
jgi:hypothetical protein